MNYDLPGDHDYSRISLGYERDSPVVGRVAFGPRVDPAERGKASVQPVPPSTVPSEIAEFIFWLANGDRRQSLGDAMRGIKSRARALLSRDDVRAALPAHMKKER
jgi:hypothetical protein